MTDIVLVEDDILLARQLTRFLEDAGWSVRHAHHAGEALAMIDAELPRVIILDMLLPVTSGLALVHELQSYSDTVVIPIVICTSMADVVTLDELRPYGVKRLVDKTKMQPADLIAAVRAVL